MPANLVLWQTEWCPSSHRVRQRLTELGLSFTARQVPVEPEARTELWEETGATTIPVLVAGEDVVRGEDAILAHLNEQFSEPADAVTQRERAAKVRREELEKSSRESGTLAGHKHQHRAGAPARPLARSSR